jgi:hypothetical protein
MKVQNMKSTLTGRKVANQFIIVNAEYNGQIGSFFQSYNTMIAFRPANGASITLDVNAWSYSKTTVKYRNLFLSETTKETEAKIVSGAHILADLNNA